MMMRCAALMAWRRCFGNARIAAVFVIVYKFFFLPEVMILVVHASGASRHLIGTTGKACVFSVTPPSATSSTYSGSVPAGLKASPGILLKIPYKQGLGGPLQTPVRTR